MYPVADEAQLVEATQRIKRKDRDQEEAIA